MKNSTKTILIFGLLNISLFASGYTALNIISITSPYTNVNPGETGIIVKMTVNNTGTFDVIVDTANTKLTFKQGTTDVSQHFNVTLSPSGTKILKRNGITDVEFTVNVLSTANTLTGNVSIDGSISGWENLIPNGGFEENSTTPPTNWIESPSADVYRNYMLDTTTMAEGKQSYKLTFTNAAIGYYVLSTINLPVAANENYTLKFYYKDEAYGSVNRYISFNDFTNFYFSHSDIWTLVSYKISVNTGKITIGLRANQNSYTGSIWFDNLQLYNENAPTLSDTTADVTGTISIGLDFTPPAAVANLSARPGTNRGEIILSWTTPGDDGNTGTATSYDIRYRTDATITDYNWTSAYMLSGEPTPTIAGTQQTMTIANLTPGVTYYFALKTQDEVDNVSAISNSASTYATPPNADTTPPTSPGTPVDEGQTSTSTTQLRFTWTAASDLESGIIRYLICIGDTPGGTNILNDRDVGNVLTYTLTGLTLTPGKTYYAKVKAMNIVGLTGPYSGNSDGITVIVLDTLQPVLGLQFTKQIGSTNDDKGYRIVTDSTGNIYVTGYTNGGLDSNMNAGGVDAFLLKYDSTGTKQWTKQIGSVNYDIANDVDVDSTGNIYVTGYTNGGLDGNTALGIYDIFLLKYDSAGTKLWTKQIGTVGDDKGYGIVTDSTGNIYVTGYTNGGLVGNIAFGSYDIFLLKYDSSGTKLWTKQIGSVNHDIANDVDVDSTGNIYVTGHTWGGLDGNINTGSSDIFLFKYDSSGTKLWTKQIGTTGGDYSTGIAVDNTGNVYVTGYTTSGLDGNTNFGESDIFLLKYDSSGTKLWTKQIGTTSVDEGYGVTVDNTDNIYITGYTRGGLDGNINVGSGDHDMFLLKYNSFGIKLWTIQTGTADSDSGSGVTVDNDANIYITGDTSGGLNGNTNVGSYDIFLLKYSYITQPVLSWTDETNFSADGLDPEIGTSATTFTFRVRYTDTDNNAPGNRYPKVCIQKGSTIVKTISMNYVSGRYNNGAIYSTSTLLSPGIYSYYFETNGIYNVSAPQFISGNGPDVKVYIKGYVKYPDGTGMNNVTVSITKDTNQKDKVTTDKVGYYEFLYLTTGGNYFVSVSSANYSFTPSIKPYPNLYDSQENQNFVVAFTSSMYNIKGYIKDTNGSSVGDVTVTLTGTTSDIYITSSTENSMSFINIKFQPIGDAMYSHQIGLYYPENVLILNDPKQKDIEVNIGPYTIPQEGLIFYMLVKETNQKYLSTDSNHCRIEQLGTDTFQYSWEDFPQGWASGSTPDLQFTVTFINDGYYGFKYLLSGDYTIKPSKKGYSFIPSSYTYFTLSKNQSEQNFIATANLMVNVNPNTLEFGRVKQSETKILAFQVYNTGDGTLSGTMSSDKEWIKVSPTSFNTNTQVVNVTVDNSILNQKDGEYTGTITVTSNGGTATVLVKLKATCVLIYPNPYLLSSNKGLTFWGTGIVPYQTKIKIYTLGMDLVKTLIEEKGNDTITWDGTNEYGDRIVPGIYFYTTESPTEKNAGRFTVIK